MRRLSPMTSMASTIRTAATTRTSARAPKAARPPAGEGLDGAFPEQDRGRERMAEGGGHLHALNYALGAS